MRVIYRFKVLFDGEPLGVGLFHALDDMGITDAEVTELTKLFDSLPCPELDEPASFWFTEEGLQTFEASINYFNSKIAFHNWSLVGAFMPAPGEEGAWFKEGRSYTRIDSSSPFPKKVCGTWYRATASHSTKSPMWIPFEKPPGMLPCLRSSGKSTSWLSTRRLPP